MPPSTSSFDHRETHPLFKPCLVFDGHPGFPWDNARNFLKDISEMIVRLMFHFPRRYVCNFDQPCKENLQIEIVTITAKIKFVENRRY